VSSADQRAIVSERGAAVPIQASGIAGTAAHMLLTTAMAAPEQIAIIDGERALKYGELAAQALAIAEGLARAGVEPNDRVAVMLQRGGDAAAAFFGVLASGAVNVTVNEALRPRQIEHILRHSQARVLLTSTAVRSRLSRPLQTSARMLDVRGIRTGEGGGEPVARLDSDVAQIIYTSGSTGLPKGVTITHRNLWSGTSSVVQYLSIRHEDRVASLLPFSFDYGLNQLLCCAATGATLVVERSPVPHRIVRTLRLMDATVLPAVPPLWLQLLAVPSFSSDPLLKLRVMTNTGGRLPATAVRRLRDCHPSADLILMYGLTEAFRSTYLSASNVDDKPTSIGRAIPGAEVLVIDEQGQRCKVGQTGQLVHRGPTVALGYWDNAEATAQVFRPSPVRPPGTPDAERVVYSGDLVYQDDDGDLFFVSREDQLIKTLGYRVSPDEVSDVLYSSGEVVEAVVTSEADEERGACIVAHVVLAQHGELARLQTFCKRELPGYMQPSRFRILSALHRTPSGKFDRDATARHNDDRQ
jgi:amino acid adenylation domain-containing protein